MHLLLAGRFINSPSLPNTWIITKAGASKRLALSFVAILIFDSKPQKHPLEVIKALRVYRGLIDVGKVKEKLHEVNSDRHT